MVKNPSRFPIQPWHFVIPEGLLSRWGHIGATGDVIPQDRASLLVVLHLQRFGKWIPFASDPMGRYFLADPKLPLDAQMGLQQKAARHMCQYLASTGLLVSEKASTYVVTVSLIRNVLEHVDSE